MHNLSSEQINDLYSKASTYIKYVITCESLMPTIDVAGEIHKSAKSNWRNLKHAVNWEIVNDILDYHDVEESSIKVLTDREKKIETTIYVVQHIGANCNNSGTKWNFHGIQGLSIIIHYWNSYNDLVKRSLKPGSKEFREEIYEAVKKSYSQFPAELRNSDQLLKFCIYWGPIVLDVLEATKKKTGGVERSILDQGDC